MSASRISIRLLLIATLLVSVAILVYAMHYSPPTSEGGWAAIAAALAVIAAVIAGWVSLKTLELQEDAQQPSLSIFVDGTSRYAFLQLCARNAGGSPARNIRIIWDKVLVNSKGDEIRFKEETGDSDIPVLVPGETASILIDEASAFFRTVQDANYAGHGHSKAACGSVLRSSEILVSFPCLMSLNRESSENSGRAIQD